MPCTLALGTDYKTGFGGKGANQCIMAAKLGVTTAMVRQGRAREFYNLWTVGALA
jgi:sugar/nucleoside kinase (ribokinase family)